MEWVVPNLSPFGSFLWGHLKSKIDSTQDLYQHIVKKRRQIISETNRSILKNKTWLWRELKWTFKRCVA